MKIVKFQGATMRDALAKVKRELGSDAIVVATRQVKRGLVGSAFEVSAAIDLDTPEPAPAPATAPRRPDPRAAPALADEDVERIMAPLRSELRWLRSQLKSNTDGRSSSDVRAELAEMRRLMEEFRSGNQTADRPTAHTPLREVARSHRIAAPSTGRVVALVGPTGVGKTTTIAKLAARAALVDGESVAVITLDNYRVGGEQQMRMFTDLIGVPLHVAHTPAELGDILYDLGGCDIVFVDTAGRSPRDTPAIDELAASLAPIDGAEVHLAVSAATAPRAIDSIYRRYRCVGVSRLLFTKVDEADELEQLVRAPARLRQPVSFFTTGQAVPEDLEEATTAGLLSLATRGHGCSAAA